VVLGDLYIKRGARDSVRSNLDALVAQYFWEVQPFGLGYMTTGKLYARHFGTEARSLHNVFQAWAFEGGLICLFLVAAILLRQFFALRLAVRFAPSAEAAAFARATAIATVTVLLIGLFHQVHQGPFLWVCLGVGLALRDRVGDDSHRP
jgi:O-antigen ligase